MRARLLLAAALLLGGASHAVAAPLRAGAARADITPAVSELPAPFKTIGSPIYIRALVLDNGAQRSVIVVGDLPTIGNGIYARLVEQVAQAGGTTPDHVILAVTHMHNAVRIDPNPVGIMLPGSAVITEKTIATMLATVKQAAANLRPARAGYAMGQTNLLADRGPRPQRQGQPEENGPIDRHIGVLKVEGMDGQPIAMLVNAPIEPVLALSDLTQVNADLAGAAERYVEQRYGDKAVVLYTVGSAESLPYSARPRKGLPQADLSALIQATGTLLGEEIIETAALARTEPVIEMGAAAKILMCPGKETTPLNLPDKCSDAPGASLPRCIFTDKPTAPVPLRIGVVKLGGLDLVQADANITKPVWQAFRKASGADSDTALISLLYGPMHYVVEDAAYPSNSYRVTASMAQRGCAAQGFIDSAQALIRQAGKKG
ncbi:hypothetical protein [Novosphingobium rosa]|uniref:hypothetical protein n=1 Tax=Novosphingobium rosa TaxID=76978 RepID=UPI00082E295B|nr:hypothetical protein [Novosphingobium rosa]